VTLVQLASLRKTVTGTAQTKRRSSGDVRLNDPSERNETPPSEAAVPDRIRRWSSRGYLPHIHADGSVHAIAFRLHDSVPASEIERWRAEIESGPRTSIGISIDRQLRQRIERYADAGHGACWLAQAEVARIVEDALLHGDDERYRLIAWCVMPNHVHVVIDPRAGWRLSTILHTWKSFTATSANRVLRRRGAFWMREYFDRYIRDSDHLFRVVRYVEQNPVTAGLCCSAQAWPWSSARARTGIGRQGE